MYLKPLTGLTLASRTLACNDAHATVLLTLCNQEDNLSTVIRIGRGVVWIFFLIALIVDLATDLRWNILFINGPNVWRHLFEGVIGLFIALGRSNRERKAFGDSLA